MKTRATAVLFGAFDRHTFGDLLFPHLLSTLLPGRGFAYCGLVARDLRRFGGHRVRALAGGASRFVHVGGELLSGSAWQAAVMLRDRRESDALVARHQACPADAAKWAAAQLGTSRTMPYVAGRDMLAPNGKLIFNAVGGVEWAALASAQRAELQAALGAADWLSVRDRVIADALRRDGIATSLCPDPAVMLRRCLGAAVDVRTGRQPVRAVREAFPQGYLACQFSADFSDGASLDAIADGLHAAAAASGLGIVLFRAALARRPLALCESACAPAAGPRPTHLRDICALIAVSRGTVASSVHVRIAALAWALPRVSLRTPQRPDKVAAFARTWEHDGLPHGVAPAAIGAATARALATPVDVLQGNADALCAAFRASVAEWAGLLAGGRPGR